AITASGGGGTPLSTNVGLTVGGDLTATTGVFSSGVAIGDTSAVSGKLFIRQSTSPTNASGLVLFNADGTASARWWIDSSANQRLDNGNAAVMPIALNGGGTGPVLINTTTNDGTNKLQVKPRLGLVAATSVQ